MVTMKGTFRLARKFSLLASWECTKNKGENMDTDVTVLKVNDRISFHFDALTVSKRRRKSKCSCSDICNSSS